MKNLVEKLPDQQPALRVMAMPPDTNQYGDVFGGWIMSQVDLAGSSIASRVANSRTRYGGRDKLHIQGACLGRRCCLVLRNGA